MTREEAVKRLEDYKNVMAESIPSDKMQEALNMAIEALKNQEAEKERIIKELENLKEGAYYKAVQNDPFSMGENWGYQNAIKIVKRGDKE